MSNSNILTLRALYSRISQNAYGPWVGPYLAALDREIRKAEKVGAEQEAAQLEGRDMGEK